MREPDLCLVEKECYGEAIACRKHYDALQARIAELERHLEMTRAQVAFLLEYPMPPVSAEVAK